MARIRQIKPEFWSSPSTAKASAVARLAFIAMWNWADDSGHGTLNIKELEGFAFPNDDVEELSSGKCRNFRHCVAEVCGSFGVTLYEVAGRAYYEVPTWQNHQRNERLAKGKHPLPEDGKTLDIPGFLRIAPEEWRKMSELPTQDNGSSVPVSGDQGIRGTGDKDSCSPAPRESDSPTRFDEFWAAFPRKVGKQTAQAKYKAAVKRSSEDEVIAGAHALAQDPNLPEPKFIPHPTTWLERNGWEDEPLPTRYGTNRANDRMRAGFDAMASYAGPTQDPWTQGALEA